MKTAEVIVKDREEIKQRSWRRRLTDRQPPHDRDIVIIILICAGLGAGIDGADGCRKQANKRDHPMQTQVESGDRRNQGEGRGPSDQVRARR